jgi:hypothetical protein
MPPLIDVQEGKDEEAVKMIKDFYTQYIGNVLRGIGERSDLFRDSLMQHSFTAGMYARVDRIAMETDGDPIIRAQDVLEEWLTTLSIGHLGNSWYMVRAYREEPMDFFYIPLHVIKEKGKYVIDYITPHWHGLQYGDKLYFDKPVKQKVTDDTFPLSFLETFYAAYTMEYCSLSPNLTSQLTAMRKQYLTPRAQADFKAVVDERMLDGERGYDALICGFDFDRLWLRPMAFTQLDENTCLLTYNGNGLKTVTLTIIKQGNKYRIDGIKAKHEY